MKYKIIIILIILLLFTVISCQIADGYLGVNADYLYNGVLDDPHIDIIVGSNRIARGETVVLKASRSGNNVTYHWESSNGSITSTGKIVTFTPDNINLSTTIECYATKNNYVDSDSESISIETIMDKLIRPTITITSGSDTMKEDSTIELTASGSDEGATYNWIVSPDVGTLSAATGETVTYTAPNGAATVTISCWATLTNYEDSNFAEQDITVTEIIYEIDVSTPKAWLQSLQTTNGSNLNDSTVYALQWYTSDLDDTYFTHSTSSNSDKLFVDQAGDYFVAVTIPITSNAGSADRSCIQAEIYVNGAAYDGAIGESSYIRNAGGDLGAHKESSVHIATLLTNLNPNDYIEVYVKGTANTNGSQLTITGRASLYAEYIVDSRTIFYATGDSSTNTSDPDDFNDITPYSIEWTSLENDSGFTHSDTNNSEKITLDSAGYYLVFVNLPLYNEDDIDRTLVKLSIQLNGTQVDGGQATQSYIRAYPSDSHYNSSAHFSGMIYSDVDNNVLTVKTSGEASTGANVDVTTGGKKGSIYIERIDDTDYLYFSKATELTGGTNWNPTTAQEVVWDDDTLIDSDVYSHSTSHQITVLSEGDYLLIYNDALKWSSQQSSYNYRQAPIISIAVNGSSISGAQTKTHYIRNANNHQESSGSLVFLLNNLSANDVITINSIAHSDDDVLTADDDALLILWKKSPIIILSE